jgi:catechol 2,3-dioxygenase-like lactoylglutathione lyase family enzyme
MEPEIEEERVMLQEFEFQATIPAADFDRARRFYEEKLELTPEVVLEAGTIYRCGKGSALFLYPTEYAGTAQHTIGGWYVDDVRATVEALRKRGVVFEEYDLPGLKTEGGIADLGSEMAAWFKDSEGNILSVATLT